MAKSTKTKKLMVSIPMRGFSDEEIKTKLDRVKDTLEPQGYEIIDSFLEKDAGEDVINPPVYYLSRSLQIMSKCDAVYFCKGWNQARGCVIEYNVALQYGVEIIKES